MLHFDGTWLEFHKLYCDGTLKYNSMRLRKAIIVNSIFGIVNCYNKDLMLWNYNEQNCWKYEYIELQIYVFSQVN